MQRSEDVVERDEVDVVAVHGGHADDVAAGSPAPIHDTVPEHNAVEKVVLRSDTQAFAERENVVRRAAQWARPNRLPGLDVKRDDTAVSRGNVETIAHHRGHTAGRRADVTR